jgi:regulator of protease activity HflC (stomatin/prohibitin superfamily)
MVSAIWFGGWFFLAGALLFAICCAINSMVVIEAKDTAYASVLGKEPKHSIMNGLKWVVPFVTEVVRMETRPTEYHHIEKDVNMPKGITVEADTNIPYQLNAPNMYKFARQWFSLEKAFSASLKAANRAILTSYSCDELLDENGKTSKVALKEEVRQEVEAKFLEILQDNYYRDLGAVFVSISMPAMDIIFPENYLNERRKVVEAEQRAKAAEAEKKAQITEAEAVAESTKIIAKADSEAIELKGAADNRVLKRKGEILEKHSSIAENEAAKRTPQTLVVGGTGITPVMDVLKGLYPHKDDDSSTTTTPPTP